jgi:hypothetical protein
MPGLKSLELSSEDMERLRREYSRIREITPFSHEPVLAGFAASIGVMREVGTANDQLARFIFDADRGEVVPLETLRASLVRLGSLTGVRIQSSASAHMDVRARGMRDLLHPEFSFNADGTIRELVIFPELAARILAGRGVEAVLVRSWGMNSIFGGFDPAKGYYQTNFWELENNDSLLFSSLVQDGRLALLGTHDFIAHAAGVRADAWPELRVQAARVHRAISTYLQNVSRPSIAALILPYTLGVVLDDLAQPPSYGSRSHVAILEELLRELASRRIDPGTPTLLREFPSQFQQIIELSRTPDIEREPWRITASVRELSREIQLHSLRSA